jgi:phosphoribosylamine--glycine ligase
MAARGYPDGYRQGDPIIGFDAAARLPGKVFHAGTRAEGAQIVTAGGRVLCAVGLGDTVAAAQAQAYQLVHAIRWDSVQYRHDIGHRAIERGDTRHGGNGGGYGAIDGGGATGV